MPSVSPLAAINIPHTWLFHPHAWPNTPVYDSLYTYILSICPLIQLNWDISEGSKSPTWSSLLRTGPYYLTSRAHWPTQVWHPIALFHVAIAIFYTTRESNRSSNREFTFLRYIWRLQFVQSLIAPCLPIHSTPRMYHDHSVPSPETYDAGSLADLHSDWKESDDGISTGIGLKLSTGDYYYIDEKIFATESGRLSKDIIEHKIQIYIANSPAIFLSLPLDSHPQMG